MFQIETTSDLLALNGEYQRLWRAGFDGTLEVSVGKGPIDAIGWSLAPGEPEGDARIDVVVRGTGGLLPLPGRVRARSLRLEHLTLTGARSGPTELWVATELAMSRVMMVDGRATDPERRGGFVEVFADGGSRRGTRVAIEDSWFVRNFQGPAPMALLWLGQRGPDAGHFESVTVARSAFLGNAFAADLAVADARAVTVEGSLFYRSWPSGAEIRCTGCVAVRLSGSLLLLEQPDQVAQVEGAPAAQLGDSVVLARAEHPAAAAALDEAIAELVSPPFQVPPAERLAELRAAAAR